MLLLVLSVCLVTELHHYAVEAELSLSDVNTANVNIQQEIIDKHNDLRKNVEPSARNMLKLTWDPKIAANAQKWADRCVFEHSPPESRSIDGIPCGENLFWSTIIFPWSYACDAWYNEKDDFQYGIGPVPEDAVVGHYTQVVWATTSKAGCGVAHCSEGRRSFNLYVCQYSPAGNVIDHMNTPYKQGTPCADCTNFCDQGLCTNPCGHRNNFTNCDSLKRQAGCDHPFVEDGCKASCYCGNKIW
ncbi:cysteine-rich venom protein triflin-like [Paroedura picta]|uniref:cysteine-rich venom protein triflin-like n=1 Tax=Paroedura picta TaxID=143630 RepID=UPI0040566531